MPMPTKELQKQYQKEWYENRKDQYKKHNQERRERRKKWFQSLLDELSCTICKESSNECLDFHHIDQLQKDEGVSRLLSDLRSMPRIIAEIQKCIIVCSNCHRKIHAGTIPNNFSKADCVVVPQQFICEVL